MLSNRSCIFSNHVLNTVYLCYFIWSWLHLTSEFFFRLKSYSHVNLAGKCCVLLLVCPESWRDKRQHETLNVWNAEVITHGMQHWLSGADVATDSTQKWLSGELTWQHTSCNTSVWRTGVTTDSMQHRLSWELTWQQTACNLKLK